jgi:hypothetical protein
MGGNNTATNTANGGAGGAGGQSTASGNGSNNLTAAGASASNNGNGNGSNNLTSQGQQQGQSANNKQGQSQAANSNQGQSQSNTGTNAQGQSSKLTGGNQATSASQSTANQNGQNIGTGNTTVNANTTSSYKAIYIPPVVPPTPASQLAVGNIVKETLACGPLMKKSERRVQGTYFGLILNSKFDQGHDDQIEPVLDANGNEMYQDVPLTNDARGEGYHRYGSQVVMFTAVIGLAGARNIAVGAGGSEGGWGQGGMGGSGSIQQMVTTVQIVPCDLGTFITKPPVVADPQPLTKIHQ